MARRAQPCAAALGVLRWPDPGRWGRDGTVQRPEGTGCLGRVDLQMGTLGKALGCAGAALGSAARRLAGRGVLTLEVSPGEGKALRVATLTAISVNWIYLLATR